MTKKYSTEAVIQSKIAQIGASFVVVLPTYQRLFESRSAAVIWLASVSPAANA